MAELHLTAPLSKADAAKLRAGDLVFLSGVIYTARDSAHKRLIELLDAGKPLPFDPEGAVIYYVGPTPAPAGRPIGSAGPTTSYRMDSYTPRLYSLGVRATVGKGKRSEAVKAAMQEYGGVYLGAVGGAGALQSQCIVASEVVGFEDLGTEAVRKLVVKDFPLAVINDTLGQEAYAKPDLAAVGLENK